jgi:hypothetical protein
MNARKIGRRLQKQECKKSKQLEDLNNLYVEIMTCIHGNLGVVKQLVQSRQLKNKDPREVANLVDAAVAITKDLQRRANGIREVINNPSKSVSIYDVILEATDRYINLSEVITEQYATVTDAIYVLSKMDSEHVKELREQYDADMDETILRESLNVLKEK